MATAAVPGFLPSRNGFRFANSWPSVPAFWLGFGLLRLGIGDAARGFCGGMAHAVRDRFERSQPPPADDVSPAAGTPLFAEISRRQLDSFDRLVVVPLRFWWAAFRPASGRDRATATEAWPQIRGDIDAGRLPMVGLIRSTGFDPLRLELGHQVVGYRYDESAERVTIGIYDPNHPGDDSIELVMRREAGGRLAVSQSSGEPLVGLLHLPYVPPTERG
jgi:hypothetical protein